MLKSNGACRAVRCMEVVRISEGPLREVPLYIVKNCDSELPSGTSKEHLCIVLEREKGRSKLCAIMKVGCERQEKGTLHASIGEYH